ncbi:hypothetical protein AMTRI_Chr03g43390 [Amborella trichopoda]
MYFLLFWLEFDKLSMFVSASTLRNTCLIPSQSHDTRCPLSRSPSALREVACNSPAHRPFFSLIDPVVSSVTFFKSLLNMEGGHALSSCAPFPPFSPIQSCSCECSHANCSFIAFCPSSCTLALSFYIAKWPDGCASSL